MIQYNLRLSLLIIFVACSTPQKSFDEGKYDQATRLALRELKKGKNREQNIRILNEAAQVKVDEAIADNSVDVASSNVADWKKAQTNYYAVLENVGKINIKTEGLITQPYDQLCELKNDLDFKIVEYHYETGSKLLNRTKAEAKRVYARDAYYEFLEAEKFGAEKFYQDLGDRKEICIELGSIYYKMNESISLNDIFLKPLPLNADMEPDCIIDVNRGAISYSESRDEVRNKLEEEIEVGQNAITDTTGKVTYEPIMQTIHGAKVTTTIKVTLATRTDVEVSNVTGECYLESRSFRSEVNDEYEEVRYEGDSRTWPIGARNMLGEPSFFRSGLEQELNNKVNRTL